MAFIEDLQSAITGGVQFDGGPSWEDRIAEAAYTPPSGIRITFDFEDQTKEFDKKATGFEFPDSDYTLVQDKGATSYRFPMVIYFTGPDCDRQADVFEAALRERGVGFLETPIYGNHKVTPVGGISREDRLKSAANQVVFKVTFFKTLDTAYPTQDTDPVSAVLTALDLFGESAAADFASSISVKSVSEQKGIIDTFNDNIAKVESNLNNIAAAQTVVSDAFQDIVDSVNNSIDVLIATPITLARKTNDLVQAPSRAITGVSARLDAYNNLAADTFTSTDALSTPGGAGNRGFRFDTFLGEGNDAQSTNKFHSRDLFAKNYLAGSVRAAIYTASTISGASTAKEIRQLQADATETDVTGSNKFLTSQDALDAAENILSQFDSLIVWRDANFKSIAGDNSSYISAPLNMDGANSIKDLQNAVALAAGYLIELSFTLLSEKIIILQSPRSIVDLCYELYGGVDEYLDFFINSNNLSGDEILELPSGTKVKYYE